MHVQNNIIVRGCLQQNPNLANDCRNRDICESCDARGNCNDRIVNGEFCITCDSQLDPNCINNVNFTMRTQCDLSVAGMGCYLFDDGGDILKRGCVTDLIPEERTYCRNQGQFCKTCEGNDCNAQLRYQQCLSCDSMTNPDCLLPNDNVSSSVCRNYIDTCMTHFENNRAIRGCSSQRTDLQLSCSNDSSLCNTCDTGMNCNNGKIEEEFCVTCDSEIDSNCRISPNMTMAQQCGPDVKLNKIGCYRFDDSGKNIMLQLYENSLHFFFFWYSSGDIVKRGCLDELRSEEIQLCRREQNECKTCDGNNCNLKVRFQSCHTCNSESNLNCLNLKEPLPTTVCRSYTDECKTVALIGGRTERGCASQLTVVGESMTCVDDNCNSNIFPANRISCHQCSGPQCSGDLSSSNTFVDLCRNFDVNDRCFSFVDGECQRKRLRDFLTQFFLETREMHRGCASDNTIDQNTCNDINQQCVQCSGSACNTPPATTQSSLSCIQCSNTDAGCAWGHTTNEAINCSPIVVFPNAESCYTLSYLNNSVARGCTLDNPLLCTGPNCRTCMGVGCNFANVITQSCKVCRSDQSGQERCGSEAFDGLEGQCGAVVKYENRGCYSKREGSTNSYYCYNVRLFRKSYNFVSGG